MARDTIEVEERYAREMIAHAQEEAPNECCGILAGCDRRITKLFRAENVEASPTRYAIAPSDVLRIYRVIEYSGWELLGIYHSHVTTRAYPSPTDVELAFWPDSLYFIVSLRRHQPHIRAFRIVNKEIAEVEVARVGE